MTKNETIAQLNSTIKKLRKSLDSIASDTDTWHSNIALEALSESQPELQPESQPLSDEEIEKMVDIWTSEYQHTIIDFARAIEKAHGIG